MDSRIDGDIKFDSDGLPIPSAKVQFDSDGFPIPQKKNSVQPSSQPPNVSGEKSSPTVSTSKGINPAPSNTVKKSLPIDLEKPQEQQPSINNNFGLPSFNQLAKGQQAASDNTANVAPLKSEQKVDFDVNHAKRVKERQDYTNKAIDNATVKALKIKGIAAQPGSVQYNQQRNQFVKQVRDGDASVATKDGEAGLKRTTGFLENIKKGWNEATTGADEADDFTNKMTTEERVAYLNKKQSEQPPSPYVGESPSLMGAAGHLAGNSAPFLGKAAEGAAIGALAVAAAPETMGASLAGLPTAMSFMLTAPDMANQGVMQGVSRRYEILKREHPERSDVDNMKEAEKGIIIDGVTGILENAALVGKGLKTPIMAESKGVIGQTLHNVANSAAHLGTVSAGFTVAQQELDNLQGVKTSQSDIVKNAAEAFKEGATTGALLTAMMHVPQMPKILKSAFKYGLKDENPQVIRGTLQANENAGNIPEGTTKKVMADLNGYKQALNKIPDGFTPESQASIAGLIQKKNNLIEESKTKDDSFKDFYQQQIQSIDGQIADIQRTGKPFEHEIDEATGKPYEQPTYDEVAKQRVQDLAKKISKNADISDPQSIQTQQNFPEQLKAELQNIADVEKKNNEGKENPNTEVADNAENYIKKNLTVNEQKNENPIQNDVKPAPDNVSRETKQVSSEPKEVSNGNTTEVNKSLPENEVKPQEQGGAVNTNKIRSSNANRIEFLKPIAGKNGNKLISYNWESNEITKGKDGKPIRQSDWGKAGVNVDTGRSIVHKFKVETKDGKILEVSADSVAKMLGYNSAELEKTFPQLKNSLKQLAMLKMNESVLSNKFNNNRSKIDEAVRNVEANIGKKIEVHPTRTHNMGYEGMPKNDIESELVRKELKKDGIYFAEIRDVADKLESVRKRIHDKSKLLDSVGGVSFGAVEKANEENKTTPKGTNSPISEIKGEQKGQGNKEAVSESIEPVGRGDAGAITSVLEEAPKEKQPNTSNEQNKGNGDFANMSDADIENRMSEIESSPTGSLESMSEFNSLEKEMEKRERDSVFSVPLDKVNDAVDALIKKDKEQPNGYGSFIDRSDARETKDVANKYLNADKLSENELKKDFKHAAMGRPKTWYADGLKLRESLKELTKRGVNIDDVLQKVADAYIHEGYDEATAKQMVAYHLKPVFEGSQKVETDESKLLEPQTENTNKISSTEKPIEAHHEVKTDFDTVAKELNLTDAQKLVYNELKNVRPEEREGALEKLQDNVRSTKEVEREIKSLQDEHESLDSEISNVNESGKTEKQKSNAVKKLKNKQEKIEQLIEDAKKEKTLENTSDLYGFDAENASELIDKVNGRIATREGVKSGNDMFPFEANIPELKQFEAKNKSEVERSEKWLQDKSNEESEIKENPEYVQQLIKKYESETTTPDVAEGQPNGEGEGNKTTGDQQGNATTGDNIRRPAEDQQQAGSSKQQSDKEPPKVGDVTEDNSDRTGIKNKVVDAEREAEGKPELKSTGDGTMEGAEKTKAKIESGEISEEQIRDLTQAIASGAKFDSGLTPTEVQHVLLYDRNTLIQKGKEIDDQLIKAREEGDDANIARLLLKREQNDALKEANDLAARKTGREWSDVGRVRQLLIKNDYTFEALKRKAKAAGGKDLTPAETERFRELSKQIEEKDAALLKMEEAQAAADKEIEELKKLNEAAKKSKEDKATQISAFDDLKNETKKQVKTQGRRTIEKIKHDRENIKANLKAKWQNHIHGGNMGANNLIPLDMAPDLVKLAKSYIEEALAVGKEAVLDKIIDRVHKDVIEALENKDISKTDVRDAITGYGKIKKPNNDPVETAFRDIAAQGRLVSSIELAQKGEPPLKTGQQRDKPTAEQRRLQKELNKEIKDNNIQVVSPEQQLKTSLDAAKTRLKNQIEDLEDAIKKGEQIKKDRKGIEYDEEANKLKQQRDELREEYDNTFGTNKELTDEDRLERATKAVGKSIEKLTEKIDKKDFSRNTNNKITSPALESLREQRKSLREAYVELMKTEGEWNRRKLEAMKKHIAKRTKYLNEIKNTGNLDKYIKDRTRQKLPLDAEAMKAKSELQKVKNDVDNMMRQREFENMSNFQKGIHYANRFFKGVLISNPAVLVRILGSVVFRGAFKAPTAVSAYGFSKLFPGLAKGAFTEAIRSRRDLTDHLIEYYSTMFSKENFEGMKFAFKNHATMEDLALNKAYHKLPIPDIKVKGLKTAIQASFFNTLKVLDKNASLHGAGKATASLPEYKAYKQTIFRNLLREGVKPEEFGQPELQEVANQLAFQKSLRAKFMQENAVSDLQKAVEEWFRRKKRPEVAEGINFLLPITKISSNYISEALTKMPLIGNLAAIKPIAKLLGRALGDGSPLTEKDKSILLRTLAYQGVGITTYMLGWYLHQYFNPMYKSSASKYAQKKKDEDEESGWLALFETLSHSPDALVFQAGVSHAWVWDKYDEEHPDEKSMATFMGSIMPAIFENARNTASSSPYISTSNTVIEPLLSGKGIGKASANLVMSRIPGSTTSKEYAEGKLPFLNKIGIKSGNEEKVKPHEVGIYPKSFMDNVSMYVPGWRQEVLKRLYDEKYNTPKVKKTHDEKLEEKRNRKEKQYKRQDFEQQLSEE